MNLDKWSFIYTIFYSYFGLSQNAFKLYNLIYMLYCNEYLHFSDLLNYSITSFDKLNTWAHEKHLPNLFFIFYFVSQIKWDEVATPIVRELLLNILQLIFRLLNSSVDILIAKIGRIYSSKEKCETITERNPNNLDQDIGRKKCYIVIHLLHCFSFFFSFY